MSSWHHRVVSNCGLQPVAYWFAQRYYDTLFHIAHARKPVALIAIFQMGKVGSSSVAATIEQLVPDRMVFHVHTMTEGGIEDTERRSATLGRAYPGPDYWAARYLRRQLNLRSENRWSIVSLARDPVARNISGFFQSLRLWCSDALSRYANKGSDVLLKELLSTFLNDYPHEKALRWFDTEISPAFGIDVFRTSFDRCSGYSVYRGNAADLLVMRVEDLSTCYRKALSEFFGRDTSHLHLMRVNESSSKNYNNLYRDFVGWVKLPEDYLEAQYSSRYARHFYSEAELDQFRQRWSKIQINHC